MFAYQILVLRVDSKSMWEYKAPSPYLLHSANATVSGTYTFSKKVITSSFKNYDMQYVPFLFGDVRKCITLWTFEFVSDWS